MNPWEDGELRIAYLLGKISLEEREALGDRLFADPAFAQLMEESERDLLDRYARGALGAEDRAAVEAHLLASDRQNAKVRFAVLMAARQPAPVTRRMPSWVVPLAAVLVLAAGLGLLRLRSSQSNPVEPTTQREKTPTAAPAPPPAVFAALLSPGGTRDGALQEVHLPATTGILRFDLESPPPADAPGYGVRLLRGAQILWSQENVLPTREADQPILSLRVPASALAAGSYEFAVRGKNGESIYRFLVR